MLPYLNASKIHPKELLRKQFKDNQFVRWDTIIRWITAEHYIKTGELHTIYTKDCDTRWYFIHKNHNDYNPGLTYGYFLIVMKSFIAYKGFNECHPVHVDEDMLLVDGTHRLGMALAMDLDIVLYKEIDRKFLGGKSTELEYYKKRFTEAEIKLMTDKYDELMKGE